MVRTGARAQALQNLMVRAGFVVATSSPPAPRLEALGSEARERVVELFESLGGQTPTPRLRPGAWDLAFSDGLVIELDEELHFNRYRAQTLQPQWAATLPWRDTYLHLCADFEKECLAAGRWGKRWTTPSCESMFGPSSPPGVLDGPGSPRWKQRALYDAVKDLAALQSPTPRLCRLSVWDQVGETTIGDALAGGPIDLDQFTDFIARRTI
ncbi:DUF7255 family protein [Mycobacterium lehmannii]|uniref:DUF7255 family protein n=1 Tax=Mycobacterium lehmannii TaxID=2048550 RepID=UPI001F61C3A6|nr:hypothetical protein [Mycobacterium lehmannii]